MPRNTQHTDCDYGLRRSVSVGTADRLAPTDVSSTRAVSILGVRSMYPCPICLVPSDKLWDLLGETHTRRTRDEAVQLIAKADAAPTKKAAKDILGAQSIRNVPVGGFCDSRVLFDLMSPRTHF